jgi:hypothetical protein
MNSIEWLCGEYDGYGISEDSDGVRVYRANGECIGVAGSLDLAFEMMRDDE